MQNSTVLCHCYFEYTLASAFYGPEVCVGQHVLIEYWDYCNKKNKTNDFYELYF